MQTITEKGTLEVEMVASKREAYSGVKKTFPKPYCCLDLKAKPQIGVHAVTTRLLPSTRWISIAVAPPPPLQITAMPY